MISESLPVRHRYHTVNGLLLHMLDFGGTGHPILLVHGVIGNSWTWHGVAAHLGGVGRLFAVDLRGYGASQWSPSADYGSDAHAADIRAVAEQMAWRSVDIVGFASGGLVGLALAQQQPSLARSVTIIDGSLSSPRPETSIPHVAMEVDSYDEAIGLERGQSTRAADSLLEVVVSHSYQAGQRGKLIRKHDPVFAERWPFRSEDWWPSLDSVRQPLLVVHGSGSKVLALEAAKEIVGRAQQGYLAEVSDSGHLVHLDQPAQLGDVLKSFLGPLET